MLDLGFYLKIFWRRLPYFLVLVALGSAAGVAVALLLPPVYVAEARLVVESEQIPDELAASTVQTDANEQLQIIEQRILTRDTLLEMANRLDIYAGVDAEDRPDSPDAAVRDMRARIGIRTTGGGRNQSQATIVRVSFTAPTARLAANVTNEVVTLMLQENIEMRTTVSGQTLDFFTQEVDRLERELARINGEILSFKENNQDALPDSLEFRRSQQAAAQERLLEQQRAETVLRDRRDRLESLYAQTGDVAFEGNAPSSAEEVRLQTLRDQLATSVAVLSQDNPRVVVLRAQIDALEEVVARQQASSVNRTDAETGQPLSPYELQLADLDGQLEFIAEQREQIEATLENLAETIAATPGNALTLSTLEQNYANLRAQYDQAVANRARAETGDMIEALSKGQRISVIEQATPPAEPNSPNRRRIAAMGMAGGLGLGFAFIALLELLNTAVRRPVDITNGLDITPIVTLPYLRTRAQVWRRRIIVGVAVLAVLVGVPAALWYVDTFVRPLQPILQGVLARAGLT